MLPCHRIHCTLHMHCCYQSATVLFCVSSAHHHIQGGKTHGSIKYLWQDDDDDRGHVRDRHHDGRTRHLNSLLVCPTADPHPSPHRSQSLCILTDMAHTLLSAVRFHNSQFLYFIGNGVATIFSKPNLTCWPRLNGSPCSVPSLSLENATSPLR
jgi:hypothetical protein